MTEMLKVHFQVLKKTKPTHHQQRPLRGTGALNLLVPVFVPIF